jgi:hypothetical protein
VSLALPEKRWRRPARQCPVDTRACDEALCLNACAKETLPNRCGIRGCLREAARTPRLVYYPQTQWQDAKGVPLDLKVTVCLEHAQTLTLRQVETEGMRNLAKNLLVADGRTEPDFSRTRLFFLPAGVVKEPEYEGTVEEARERSRIIRWD